MKRRLLEACWAVACIAALGCGPGKSKGEAKSAAPRSSAVQSRIDKQTLVFNIGGFPETLDPHKSTGVTEHRIALTMINGLTRLDEKGNAKPAMAESWTANADFSAFTFKLRDAKWSNGDPVTAQDFVDSWRRVVDPNTAADYAYQLDYIKGASAIYKKDKADSKPEDLEGLGAKAVDARTLEVQLIGPSPFFPELVSHGAYYPVHMPSVKAHPDDWNRNPEFYVGNGPFKLVEFKDDDRVVVDKNPAFWDAANVKLNRVVFRAIKEESTAFVAYESGELDIDPYVPKPQLPVLSKRADYLVAPSAGTYYVGFNCEKAPFNDVRVREAFTIVIDREKIVKEIAKGGEAPAYAFTPPSLLNRATGKSMREEVPGYFKVDIERARKLMADAGFPEGKGFPKVSYLYNELENHKMIGEAMQQMWLKALGVDVTLERKDWKSYLQQRQLGNYFICRAAWIADFGDPINFLDMFLSESGNNNSKWKNADYDKQLDTIKQTADVPKRFQLMHDAEKLLMSEFPLAPIYFYTEPVLQREYVHGVVRNEMHWADVTYAWMGDK